jgi:transcriptional regulator with XRE-family HTH domain
MSEKFKSEHEVNHIAARLREQRALLGLTLVDIESALGVNRGQLSRLEGGSFKTNSPNLQKYVQYLQNSMEDLQRPSITLGSRFEGFAARSPLHRAAAEEVLRALERLG